MTKLPGRSQQRRRIDTFHDQALISRRFQTLFVICSYVCKYTNKCIQIYCLFVNKKHDLYRPKPNRYPLAMPDIQQRLNRETPDWQISRQPFNAARAPRFLSLKRSHIHLNNLPSGAFSAGLSVPSPIRFLLIRIRILFLIPSGKCGSLQLPLEVREQSAKVFTDKRVLRNILKSTNYKCFCAKKLSAKFFIRW